jgi:hypothetical protein
MGVGERERERERDLYKAGHDKFVFVLLVGNQKFESMYFEWIVA